MTTRGNNTHVPAANSTDEPIVAGSFKLNKELNYHRLGGEKAIILSSDTALGENVLLVHVN